MPLDLHIKSMAAQATLRVMGCNHPNWDGVGRGQLRGHLHQPLKTLKELELFPRLQYMTLGDPGSGTKSYKSKKKLYLPQTALDAMQGDVN